MTIIKFISCLALFSAGLACQARGNDVNQSLILSSSAESVINKMLGLTGKYDRPVLYGLLSIQGYLIKNPSYKDENLHDYDLNSPRVTNVTTIEGRHYYLVSFSNVDEAQDKAAFSILQKCENEIFIPLVTGFGLYHDKLVSEFKSASKNSSADYFEWDVCTDVLAYE